MTDGRRNVQFQLGEFWISIIVEIACIIIQRQNFWRFRSAALSDGKWSNGRLILGARWIAVHFKSLFKNLKLRCSMAGTHSGSPWLSDWLPVLRHSDNLFAGQPLQASRSGESAAKLTVDVPSFRLKLLGRNLSALPPLTSNEYSWNTIPQWNENECMRIFLCSTGANTSFESFRLVNLGLVSDSANLRSHF